VKHQPNNPKPAVYVSDLLRKRHRKLVLNLECVLGRHGVELREVTGTTDIWARDYLPIQRHDGVFVSYTYRPDYLRGCPQLVTDWRTVKGLPEAWKVEDCGLILDGGNVVLCDRSAVVTEKVFIENPELSRSQVESRLRDAFHLTCG
jgi:agmatine deiminase